MQTLSAMHGQWPLTHAHPLCCLLLLAGSVAAPLLKRLCANAFVMFQQHVSSIEGVMQLSRAAHVWLL